MVHGMHPTIFHSSGSLPESSITVMRRACAFTRYHARTNWIIRRANRAEQLAILRALHTAQDRAAFAGSVVGNRHCRNLEALFGIEGRVLRLDAQRAVGHRPE